MEESAGQEGQEGQEVARAEWPARIASFALSPDGEQIGFHLETREDEWSIETMPLSGGPRTTVLSGVTSAWGVRAWVWTPDGKSILFVRFTSGEVKVERELWKLDPATGTIEPLEISAPGLQTIAIDPTGTRIAFAAGTQAPSSDLRVLGNFLRELEGR